MPSKEHALLTKEQTDFLKEKILGEIHRIEQNLRQNSGQYGLEKDAIKDEVDEATENSLISMSARLSTRDNLYLKRLYKALKQIEAGQYGVCNDCGAPIGFARLNARPTSELCLQCKEETEQEERQSIIGHQSKSLGQSLHFEAR